MGALGLSALIFHERLTHAQLVSAAILLVLGSETPAQAEEQHCFESLRDCYGRAAGRDGFWDRTAAGLDCELTFVDCVRRAV